MNDVKRQMPYDEPQGYVEQLVNKSTARALKAYRPAPRRFWWLKGAAAAAMLVAAGLTAWHVVPSADEPQAPVAQSTYAPIDEFLNGISDEEARQIHYYEIEEIPEL